MPTAGEMAGALQAAINELHGLTNFIQGLLDQASNCKIACHQVGSDLPGVGACLAELEQITNAVEDVAGLAPQSIERLEALSRLF